MTCNQAVWLCVGISATAGLWWISQAESEIQAGESSSKVRSLQSYIDEANPTDGGPVDRAVYQSDKTSEVHSQITPTGLWDSRLKPKAKSAPKPLTKLNPLSRFKKQPVQDPFLESESEQAAEPTESTESEDDAEAEETPVEERVAPQAPRSKSRQSVVPQNRKRLLRYRASVDEAESTDTAQPAPTKSRSVADKATEESTRPVTSRGKNVREPESETALRSLFEGSTEEAVAKRDAVSDPTVSHHDFEEAPASPSSEKQIQQVSRGNESESESESSPVAASKVEPREDDLFDLPATAETPSTPDLPPQQLTEPESPVTLAKPSSKPEKLRADEAEVKESHSTPDADAPQPTTPRTPSSEPSRPVRPSHIAEEPAGKARVDDKSTNAPKAGAAAVAKVVEPTANPEAPSKARKIQRTAPRATAKVPPTRDRASRSVSTADVELPVIRPAPKLGQQVPPTIEANRAFSTSATTTESTESAEEPVPSPRVTEARIRPKQARVLPPVQVRANRAMQIEPPPGWSATQKRNRISDDSSTLNRSEMDRHESATVEEAVPSDENDEPQFPAASDEGGTDEVPPLSEAPVTLKKPRQPATLQVVRVNSDAPAQVNSAVFQSPPLMIEAEPEPVKAQVNEQEPVIIPELTRETHTPWTTWLVIAFGAGFAICRLLIRPANAE